MLQQIGDLAGAIVRIDRHAGGADRVQRQLDEEMFRPVVEQHRHPVSVAEPCGAERLRHGLDLTAGRGEVDGIARPVTGDSL